MSEVWRYGSADGQIPGHLRAMLADVATAAEPERRDAVDAWSRRLRSDESGGSGGPVTLGAADAREPGSSSAAPGGDPDGRARWR